MSEREHADVRSFEKDLSEAVSRLDSWLTDGHAIRSELALRLHALREAEDPAVADAVADLERRMEDDHPYEDAVDVDRLADLLHR